MKFRGLLIECGVSCVAALMGLGGGCSTQDHDSYYYEEDALGREVIRPEDNENWRSHARQREEQLKWDRGRNRPAEAGVDPLQPSDTPETIVVPEPETIIIPE